MTNGRLPEWTIGARWKRDGLETVTEVRILYLPPIKCPGGVMAAAPDLGSGVERRGSSSLPWGTNKEKDDGNDEKGSNNCSGCCGSCCVEFCRLLPVHAI